MNNFVMGLKRFITNKNVVTILGVLVVLVILFFGYTSSIKKQTKPVSIPVAAKKINAETEITAEDIRYIEVSESMVGEGVIRSSSELIGKYTNLIATVPEGSMFYRSVVVDESQIPGNWIEKLDYEAGELGYYMSVNVENTLGNSVKPNTYIDIYMQSNDENGTPMFGKLLKNIKVLVVHDGSGHNVFRDAEAIGSPSKIGFAVSPDLYKLLKKAELLRVSLTIVPRGSRVPSEDKIIVTSSVLRDHILHRTAEVEEKDVIEEPEDTNEEIVDTEEEIIENQEVVE